MSQSTAGVKDVLNPCANLSPPNVDLLYLMVIAHQLAHAIVKEERWFYQPSGLSGGEKVVSGNSGWSSDSI